MYAVDGRTCRYHALPPRVSPAAYHSGITRKRTACAWLLRGEYALTELYALATYAPLRHGAFRLLYAALPHVAPAGWRTAATFARTTRHGGLPLVARLVRTRVSSNIPQPVFTGLNGEPKTPPPAYRCPPPVWGAGRGGGQRRCAFVPWTLPAALLHITCPVPFGMGAWIAHLSL